MNNQSASSWAVMLVASCAFGIAIGFSLGYALFAPGNSGVDPASVSAETTPGRAIQGETQRAESEWSAQPASQPAPSRVTPAADNGYWAGRHLFVAVNGQWLADPAKALLREIRPGGIVLRDVNLGSRAQTFALVKEIKQAVGIGDGLGDLPLIAIQHEGGPYNVLDVENAPSAQAIGQQADPEIARRLGQQYAQACVGRGIALAFAPVLDIYQKGAIDPSYAVRSFGSDQQRVARLGLAMVEGYREGGVLPVVKHFPGYGAATFGPDGLSVVLNQDFSGLAEILYPFNEAVRHGVPGVLVGHVAVPALDTEEPMRPAALSPILVTELLRKRWGYDGVVIADDVSLNPMTRDLGAAEAAVRALEAGCDAVVLLDPDPARIREAIHEIVAAVDAGRLSEPLLQESVARLNKWQRAVGNLNPIRQEPSSPQSQVAHAAEEAMTADLRANTPSQDSAAPLPEPEEDTSDDPVATRSSPPETERLARTVPATPESATDPNTDMESTSDLGSVPADEEERSPGGHEASVAEKPVGDSERSQIEHVVQKGDSLTSVAELYGVTEDELRDWNDLSETGIEPGTHLELFLPAGSNAVQPDPTTKTASENESEPETLARNKPAGLTAPPLPDGVATKLIHFVKPDENLQDVADRYRVSLADIRLWNGLEQDELESGQQLTIFLGGDAESPSSDSEPSDSATMPTAGSDTSEAEAATVAETTEQTDSPTDPGETMTYTVQSGDTLMKIAREHDTTQSVLSELNGITNPNHIFVGQKIKVPVAQ